MIIIHNKSNYLEFCLMSIACWKFDRNTCQLVITFANETKEIYDGDIARVLHIRLSEAGNLKDTPIFFADVNDLLYDVVADMFKRVKIICPFKGIAN